MEKYFLYNSLVINIFVCLRSSEKKCGLCNRYIDEAQYRSHVAKCGVSNDDDEVQAVLKVCPLCEKQVKDLAQHCQKCTGGDDTTNYKHERRRKSPSPPVRSF